MPGWDLWHRRDEDRPLVQQAQHGVMQEAEGSCQGVAKGCQQGPDGPDMQTALWPSVLGRSPQAVIREAWIGNMAAQNLKPPCQYLQFRNIGWSRQWRSVAH